MLHRCAFPLSRNVVTASLHPPPLSHVPRVRVDAERCRGQHSSWLEPSALHGHRTGVRRRRKPRGASREGGCFDLPCHGAPGAGVVLGRPVPAHPNHQKTLETVAIAPPAPFGWCIRSPWPYVAPGVAAWPFGSAKSPPKVLVDNGRLFCLVYWANDGLDRPLT